MIGLVRELTRASLFDAAWKPLIAFSCLARMKSSSVKALTMRMPCTVSASDSIICIAPWNSVAMMPRTRTPILRTPTAASGTNISAKIDSRGSVDTITMTSPTMVSASRENVVMRTLSTLLADCEMNDWRAMNSEECDRL